MELLQLALMGFYNPKFVNKRKRTAKLFNYSNK